MKGAPNLTSANFVSWVNEKWDVRVCEETARLWLHKMGFTFRQFSKGVYFDGHERDAVVKHRKEYLDTLSFLQDRMLTSPSQYPPPTTTTLPPIIRVFHGESTFHANADQTFHWSDGSNQALKQKSLGQAVMVSDFIDEIDGLEKMRHVCTWSTRVKAMTSSWTKSAKQWTYLRRSTLVLLVCSSSIERGHMCLFLPRFHCELRTLLVSRQEVH